LKGGGEDGGIIGMFEEGKEAGEGAGERDKGEVADFAGEAEAFAEGTSEVKDGTDLPGFRNGGCSNEGIGGPFGGVEDLREGRVLVLRRMDEDVLTGGWDHLARARNACGFSTRFQPQL